MSRGGGRGRQNPMAGMQAFECAGACVEVAAAAGAGACFPGTGGARCRTLRWGGPAPLNLSAHVFNASATRWPDTCASLHTRLLCEESYHDCAVSTTAPALCTSFRALCAPRFPCASALRALLEDAGFDLAQFLFILLLALFLGYSMHALHRARTRRVTLAVLLYVIALAGPAPTSCMWPAAFIGALAARGGAGAGARRAARWVSIGALLLELEVAVVWLSSTQSAPWVYHARLSALIGGAWLAGGALLALGRSCSTRYFHALSDLACHATVGTLLAALALIPPLYGLDVRFIHALPVGVAVIGSLALNAYPRLMYLFHRRPRRRARASTLIQPDSAHVALIQPASGASGASGAAPERKHEHHTEYGGMLALQAARVLWLAFNVGVSAADARLFAAIALGTAVLSFGVIFSTDERAPAPAAPAAPAASWANEDFELSWVKEHIEPSPKPSPKPKSAPSPPEARMSAAAAGAAAGVAFNALSGNSDTEGSDAGSGSGGHISDIDLNLDLDLDSGAVGDGALDEGAVYVDVVPRPSD